LSSQPDAAPLAILRPGVLKRLQAWLVAGCLAALAAGPALAENPYSYVKFSLEVPWTLYFVFLVMVSLPFAVMILLAWQRGRSEEEPDPSTTKGRQAGQGGLTSNERRA
jgi:hypothetical protein